jgi:hypothetical protein
MRFAPVDGHPGYVTGVDGLAAPAAQLEFGAVSVAAGELQLPEASFLDAETRAELERVLVAQAQDQDSLRYREFNDRGEAWLWRSELVLVAMPPERAVWGDYSSLFSFFGGWWEHSLDACETWTNDPACDQQLSVFPIHTASPLYRSEDYESADVHYLVYEATHVSRGSAWGEVVAPSEPDPISGTLVIKWRPPFRPVEYQKLSYRVLPDEKFLLGRWSARESSAASIADPEIPGSPDQCDGEQVVCYEHGPHHTGVGGPSEDKQPSRP